MGVYYLKVQLDDEGVLQRKPGLHYHARSYKVPLNLQYSEILIPLKSLEEGVDLVFQLFYKDWSSVKPIDNSIVYD